MQKERGKERLIGRNKEKGWALVAAIVFSFILTLLGIGFFSLSHHEVALVGDQEKSQQAFQTAEAGLEWILRVSADPATDDHLQNWVAANGWGTFRTANLGAGTYSLSVSGLDAGYYTVTSTGTVGSSTRAITMGIKPGVTGSMAQFMFLTANADQNWGTGASVWGDIHTNKNLKIYHLGDPLKLNFHDGVSASGDISYYWGAKEGVNVFYHETGQPVKGAAKIEMPKMNDNLKTYAQNDGYYYTGSTTTVELKSDGKVKINGVEKDLPPNGVIYAEGDVEVKRTLNGKLTIVSKKDVEITGNIVYKNGTAEGHPDVLGLIAQKDVLVTKDVPKDTTINAAMLAVDGTVKIADDIGSKGTLNITGSIVKNKFGYFKSGEIGYTTRNYYFDPNFYTSEPPHYLHYEALKTQGWKEV